MRRNFPYFPRLRATRYSVPTGSTSTYHPFSTLPRTSAAGSGLRTMICQRLSPLILPKKHGAGPTRSVAGELVGADLRSASLRASRVGLGLGAGGVGVAVDQPHHAPEGRVAQLLAVAQLARVEGGVVVPGGGLDDVVLGRCRFAARRARPAGRGRRGRPPGSAPGRCARRRGSRAGPGPRRRR